MSGRGHAARRRAGGQMNARAAMLLAAALAFLPGRSLAGG